MWPDQSPEWKEVDHYPNSEARAAAWQVFNHLDELQPDATGAQVDQFGKIPFLRLDENAQGLFGEWRKDLETTRLRGDLAPALESHFAKYRKLVPSLALINHLADGGTEAISETAMLRALAFADYLETHARRAYGAGAEIETSAAKATLARIRKGDLSDGFTGRDVHRPRWSNLSGRDHASRAGPSL